MNRPMLRYSAKALLANSEGEILLIREAKGDNSGKYHFPGGHLNPDEGPRKALKREVAEEVGITQMEIGRPFYSCEWPATIGGQLLTVVGVFYPCKTEQQEVTLSAEHDAALWIPPEDYVILPMVNHSQQIIESYLVDQSQGIRHVVTTDEIL